MSDTDSPPKPGSGQDISRRMDRMEQRHEELAREVSTLMSSVARVEANQSHQGELTKLRFDTLDSSLKTVDLNLEGFMRRVNGLISGEVRMPAGEAFLKEYQEWRSKVDSRLDAQQVLVGQVTLLGRIATILIGGNAIAIIGAIAWLASGHPL